MGFRILTLTTLIFLTLIGCAHDPQLKNDSTIIRSKVSLKKASIQNYERLSESTKLALVEFSENNSDRRPLNQFVETKVPEPKVQETKVQEIKVSEQRLVQLQETKAPIQPKLQPSETKLPVQPIVQLSEIKVQEQPEIQTLNQTNNVEIYETISPFAGYEVELFDSGAVEFDNTVQYVVEIYDTYPDNRATTYTNSRNVEFGKLNGYPNPADWRNCESSNSGYLLLDENDLQLNPNFEVCMRNKGYILSTEYNAFSHPTLSAKSVELENTIQYTELTLDTELNFGS